MFSYSEPKPITLSGTDVQTVGNVYRDVYDF